MDSKLAVVSLMALPAAVFGLGAYLPAKPTAGVRHLSASTKPSLLQKTCVPCHNNTLAQGGLNFQTLPVRPSDPDNYQTWVRAYDRVLSGEMPPKGSIGFNAGQKSLTLNMLAAPLVAFDTKRTKTQGRSTWRRMTREEYESTLRDILGAPWLQIKELLPEDGIRSHFSKVGEALDVSYVQMGRYLVAAEYALRESLASSPTQPKIMKRKFYARQQSSFLGPADLQNFNGAFERATWPMLGNMPDRAAQEGKAPMTVGESNPAQREEEAIGYACSAYEPIEPTFDRFTAPSAGKYRLKFSGYSFWTLPESEKLWFRPHRDKAEIGRTTEPVTVYAEVQPRQLRRLGTFDLVPERDAKDAKLHEMDVWLRKGESIRPDPARFFRSRPPYPWRNPHARKDGQPAVAFRWLEVEGPFHATWPTAGQNLLFGSLPISTDSDGAIRVTPTSIESDCSRLMTQFLTRVWRRSVAPADVIPYVDLARTSRNKGLSFMDAQILAYSAILCAPAFVTLEERPGPLSAVALASRLSYFLWNTEPDSALRLAAQAAVAKTAKKIPDTLGKQVDRLLADKRSQRFVDNFLDYWLDLRKVGIVSPDEILYVDYYLDDLLVESSIDEPRLFFADLIRRNRPAHELIDANYVFVNGRLATHYGIPDVYGSAFKRVSLPANSVRGGLLTMAGVLKVTANGTSTSPVVRGAWVNDRLLGMPVPPPPKAVPAVEPDIRGATTIREQLAKHRSDPSCNSCHVKIDPPGFALEAFDVFGGFRENYRALGSQPPLTGFGPNGQPFSFHNGMKIDPSGVLLKGGAFRDIRSFKKCLLQDKRQIARNFVHQLVTYATGAPVRFGDRPGIEMILDQAKSTNYGVNCLIHAVVNSPLFWNK